MDPDDRPYSLGWADGGAVEPLPVHTPDDEGPRRQAGRRRVEPQAVPGRSWDSTDQDELDTWWANVSGGGLGSGTEKA